MKYFLIIFVSILIIVVALVVVYRVLQSKKRAAQQKLLSDALNYLKLSERQIKMFFEEYQISVTVKSRQSLEKYDYPSFFKTNREYFSIINDFLIVKGRILVDLKNFLKNNPFMNDKEYSFLVSYIKQCIASGCKYIIRVKYISSAGNCLGIRDFPLTITTLKEIEDKPELYMTKSEMKEIEKEKLESKKKETYYNVSKIIDMANELKNNLITKKEIKTLDNLIANLFDRTVNSIQKIKQLNSDEWSLINKVINETEKEVNSIKTRNDKLRNYYSSKDFAELKKTCELLMVSQRDFNVYIEEKISAISKMFGTRIT